nr:cryptochrome/photolyase family protein [Rugamonas sp.]
MLHHAQKILAILPAMRDMARQLRKDGLKVHYLAIDDAGNQQFICANIDAHYQAVAVEYQAPDEWRLDQQLYDYGRRSTIPWRMVDSDHFYAVHNPAADIFSRHKQWRMEFF